MNFHTEKQPSPKPTPKQQQAVDVAKQNLELQEMLANSAAHIQQLVRVLWLTVQAAGGQVTLDESKVDPLWRLDKKRLDDGKLVLTASVTPPPSGEELDRLVNKLMGTQLRIEEVSKELGLENWPPAYLAFQISNRLAWFNNAWTDASLARGLAQGNENN
jgi:hypothetical protein